MFIAFVKIECENKYTVLTFCYLFSLILVALEKRGIGISEKTRKTKKRGTDISKKTRKTKKRGSDKSGRTRNRGIDLSENTGKTKKIKV